ncbi:MAG: hypothetical protein HYW88_00360 [Candidatus Sungbacteria bacterium]|nr:hypothetical protein [Candidatus Sungbacteria bacterium]
MSAAIINAKWIVANPREGVYDWALLDKKISDWTGSRDPNKDTPKKIFIRLATYEQDPLTVEECKNYGSDCRAGDNSGNPPWIYGKGVPRITFVCGGVCKGEKTVSVPQVWDPRFIAAYGEFIEALGAHYNNDKRVAGFLPGFGHLGTMNAQPSKGGAVAFFQAGWTVEKWRDYIEDVIDLSERHLAKRLMVRTPGKFLENVEGTSFKLRDHLDIARAVLKYSAERDISILFHGLNPNEEQYKEAAIPELVAYLGSLNIRSASFAVGFDDDWPLWVPDDRANECPGSTCGRNILGFEKELKEAFAAWDSSARKYPIFFAFLEPEASATNPNNRGKFDKQGNEIFRQDVYNLLVKELSGALR